MNLIKAKFSSTDLKTKSTSLRILLALGFTPLFFGCSNGQLPKYSVIQSLRILSLNLDHPEINFDGSTFTPSSLNLTPAVSDLYGAGRPLSYNLEWCLDPGIPIGAPPICAGNPTQTSLATAQSVSLTSTFLSPNFTGQLAPITVDLTTASPSALALIGQRFLSSTPTQQYNGIALIVRYELYVTSDPTLKASAFKRIILSGPAKTSKNQNPSGLQIQIGGVEITDLPTSNTNLLAYLPTPQAENYSQMDSNGNLVAKTETLETTWFFTGPQDISCANDKTCTSDGLFNRTRTDMNELNLFYAPIVPLPTTRGRVLMAVARDNRGGNVVKRYCFGICP